MSKSKKTSARRKFVKGFGYSLMIIGVYTGVQYALEKGSENFETNTGN